MSNMFISFWKNVIRIVLIFTRFIQDDLAKFIGNTEQVVKYINIQTSKELKKYTIRNKIIKFPIQ